MNFNRFINNFQFGCKIRYSENWGKYNKKLSKQALSIESNKTCLTEFLLSKYIF